VTINTAIAIAVHATMVALSALPHFPAERADRFYTVQILATSIENRQALLSIHDSLREKGRLVYYYPKRVNGRRYWRLRTGIFEQAAQAGTYAEMLKKEGFECFVARADVAVTTFKDRFRIVTTPSGIWLAQGSSARELYAPAREQIDLGYTAPRISPDGTAIAFYADRRIVRVTLETGAVQILREAASDDDLFHSVVRWSPDGRYIGYLDVAEWELPTRLWIMRADGTENRCLVGDETCQTKVKSFEWHPYKNRFFYVSGPTYGTVSLGGHLCCIDLDGTRRTLVEAELRGGIEVLAEFRIASGLLEYRIAHHNADGKEPQYTLHKRPLSELD